MRFAIDQRDRLFSNLHIRECMSRDNLLNTNVAKRIGVNYRLVEVCYITNPNEVTYLKKNVDQIAKDFAAAIINVVSSSSTAVSGSGRVTPGTYRIYTGTFRTKEEAEAARDKIAETLGYNPVVRKEG
jgi:hypothetical protein